MTSLHYTLIALGVGLVGAMFLYNIFQERRSRKQADRMFGVGEPLPEREDKVDLSGEMAPIGHTVGARIEPSLDLTRAAVEEDEIRVDDYPVQEDAGGTIVQASARLETGTEASSSRVEPESPLDSAIEYVARLRYAHPVSLSFNALLDTLRRISKPIRLVGQREDGEWETIPGHAVRPYETVELSLLLADRAGPVSEVQIDTFCRRLYEFAGEHGGAVSCQDKADALARAKTLDAFCAEVDMLIGLNVIPAEGEEFSLHAVQEFADYAGLSRNADGTYQMRDDAGRVLFNLALHNELLSHDEQGVQGCQGISLLFDVPRVAHGLEAFDRMAMLGFDLAGRLGGQLVDDGGRAVSRDSLLKDRRRLEVLYARMDQHAIPAGGERALRLFV